MFVGVFVCLSVCLQGFLSVCVIVCLFVPSSLPPRPFVPSFVRPLFVRVFVLEFLLCVFSSVDLCLIVGGCLFVCLLGCGGVCLLGVFVGVWGVYLFVCCSLVHSIFRLLC